jgi:hypothetical protein
MLKIRLNVANRDDDDDDDDLLIARGLDMLTFNF